jgi:cytochrome P450
LSRDESVYPNPDNFIPERWLPDAEGITHHRLDQLRPFGFGKRVCPGMYLAEVTTFMYCSHILAGFNIGKCLDANGLEMEPNVKFAEGVLQLVSSILLA